MATSLDPLFVFDRFIVGNGNRLAVAAARRVSESPGRSYNPLVICGGSGLGKTHLLHALGDRAALMEPDLVVHYETIDGLGRGLDGHDGSAVDDLQARMSGVNVLLLDDLQRITGRTRVQDEILRVLELLVHGGAQVVVASDRALNEIPALGTRLATWLSAGLMLDVAAPDAETRRSIVRQILFERGIGLDEDVLDALVRLGTQNVNELQGALNRLLAVAELEGRAVRPAEVAELVGIEEARDPPAGEFDVFLTDISTELASVVETIAPAPVVAPPVSSPDDWFHDREKFAWGWLSLDERIAEGPR